MRVAWRGEVAGRVRLRTTRCDAKRRHGSQKPRRVAQFACIPRPATVGGSIGSCTPSAALPRSAESYTETPPNGVGERERVWARAAVGCVHSPSGVVSYGFSPALAPPKGAPATPILNRRTASRLCDTMCLHSASYVAALSPAGACTSVNAGCRLVIPFALREGRIRTRTLCAMALTHCDGCDCLRTVSGRRSLAQGYSTEMG